MKVFDCTTFYNENMMLELRFNILDPYVDKFVITESKYSHSGEKKKLNFDINKFKDFKKKINYIVVENEPNNLFDETPHPEAHYQSIHLSCYHFLQLHVLERALSLQDVILGIQQRRL